MSRLHRAVMLAVLLLPTSGSARIDQPLARTVLALYNSMEEAQIAGSRIHALAEMPLNHLGLVLRYHDVASGLPRDDEIEGVRGILTWFASDRVPDPETYVRWALDAIDRGTRFVVLGTLGVDAQATAAPGLRSGVRRFWEALGMRALDEWIVTTYDLRISHRSVEMVDFERAVDRDPFPPFRRMQVLDGRAQSLLTLSPKKAGDERNDLIVLAANGGYVATGYTHYSDPASGATQWYIDPLAFFARALGTDTLPKPDATTLCGRRLFYAQVDGDGWCNRSEVPRHRKRGASAAQAVLEDVVRAFPDLPFTVGPIVEDIDAAPYGSPEYLALGLLSSANVEAASHTLSHPGFWTPRDDSDAVMAETTPRQETGAGTSHASQSVLERLLHLISVTRADQTRDGDLGVDPGASVATRAAPWGDNGRAIDLEAEITGSIEALDRLLPDGKKVALLAWSGDTSPPEQALALLEQIGIRNLNGGPSCFDRPLFSYSCLSPLARQVGRRWQIYGSNGNEDTAMGLRSDRLFSLQQVTDLMDRTETPVRLKPLQVYFHMYAGQTEAGLHGVTELLRYANAQPIVPVTASRYAAIVEGSLSARLIDLGEDRWRIEDRGALATVRFDHAALRRVDFERSEGVIGQRHYQGSLYVALDETHEAPVVALTDHADIGQHPVSNRPYLIESRWRIYDVVARSQGVRFTAEGHGRGDMHWQLPCAASVRGIAVDATGQHTEIAARTDDEGRLRLALDASAIAPVSIELHWQGGAMR